MKFHGIRMEGKFIIERLVTLPTWAASDEGRMIYDTTEKKLFIGNDTGWMEAGGGGGYGLPVTNFVDNDVLESGKMYFIDTSSGSLTGNLDPSPSVGDTITVVDIGSSFGMYSLTINGNTNDIHTDTALEVDVKDTVLIFVYTGVSWKLDVGGIVGGGSSGSSGVTEITEYDSDFTAEAGSAFVDTSTAPIIVTLPNEVGLTTGTTVTIFDQFATFSTNSCTVISPTAEFENGTSSIELINDGSKTTFMWDNSSGQWKTEQSADTGAAGLGNITNITGDYDANAGDFLFIDTSSNVVNLTFPPSAQIGSKAVISIYDQTENFDTNNVIITPAYGTINNGDATYSAVSKGVRIDFIWDNENTDWKLDVGGLYGGSGGSGSPATEGDYGVIKLASHAEVMGGLDGEKAVTSVNLESKLSSYITGDFIWSIMNSAETCVVGNKYMVDTSGGAFTATLPLTAAEGKSVKFADGGDFSANNLTIDRNGNTIEGMSENMTVTTENMSFELVFYNNDWRLA